MNLRRKIALIVFIIILLIGSFFMGFQAGVKTTISWGVKVASHFINFTINQQELSNAIYQYQNNIGACFT